jgi:hypothetical protein
MTWTVINGVTHRLLKPGDLLECDGDHFEGRYLQWTPGQEWCRECKWDDGFGQNWPVAALQGNEIIQYKGDPDALKKLWDREMEGQNAALKKLWTAEGGISDKVPTARGAARSDYYMLPYHNADRCLLVEVDHDRPDFVIAGIPIDGLVARTLDTKGKIALFLKHNEKDPTFFEAYGPNDTGPETEETRAKVPTLEHFARALHMCDPDVLVFACEVGEDRGPSVMRAIETMWDRDELGLRTKWLDVAKRALDILSRP